MNRQGYTVLEVTIATAVMGVLMTAVLVNLQSMMHVAAVYTDAAHSHEQANNAVEGMAEAMRESKIIDYVAVEAGANTITFCTPVDPDGDGDPVGTAYYDSTKKEWVYPVEWGVRRPSPNGIVDLVDKTVSEPRDASSDATFTSTYFFDKIGEFNEVAEKYDLNRDGDSTDLFAVGNIVRRHSGGVDDTHGKFPESDMVVATDVLQLIIGGVIDPNGDIDSGMTGGDPDADPIFEREGSLLRIHIFVAKTSADDPIISHRFTEIWLENGMIMEADETP